MSTSPDPNTSPVVTMTVWGVARHRVPGAVGRLAVHRRPLRALPGLRFAKMLGTSHGRSFGLADVDSGHWAILAAWEDDAAADAFVTAPLHRSWDRIAAERLDLRLAPISSRGSWSGQRPFDLPPGRQARHPDDAPVAAITRARLRPGRALSFWRAVPPVSADLAATPGLRLAIGVGEAPLGWQGTFSMWESAGDLSRFAYQRAAHADVVRRTGPQRWYAEEMFARFAVRRVTGSYAGTSVAGG